MRHLLEYRPRMKSRGPLTIVALTMFFALSASAQINGVPASVTSYGFGGHVVPNAPRASVTSLGPNGFGFSPVPQYFNRPHFTVAPGQPSHGHDGHHHNHTYPYASFYYPYYPVVDPYMYSAPMDAGPNGDQAENYDDQYEGGPTIFDRRGPGAPPPNNYYVTPPPIQTAEAPAASAPVAEAAPDEPQPSTILVFKDGHKLEVENYAIVGANLFDLSAGHRQKIPIADLDVAATQKANEDQGIEFKLPSVPSGS